jgi:hypothetical protein
LSYSLWQIVENKITNDTADIYWNETLWLITGMYDLFINSVYHSDGHSGRNCRKKFSGNVGIESIVTFIRIDQNWNFEKSKVNVNVRGIEFPDDVNF